jgi:hypothetical protein
MVQGLGFLSKKSWHTKNKVNQEKVWVAEQQKEAEVAKTKELAKQIQQEREQEELDKITGKTSIVKDRGIDWMYQGETQHGEVAKQDAERRAEEYLLGKEFVGEGGVQGDFDDGKQKEGIHSVLGSNNLSAAASSNVESVPPPHTLLLLLQREQQASQGTSNKDDPSAKWGGAQLTTASTEPSVHDRNESFRLRVEDPMYMVSQKRREKEYKHEKAKALYEKVVGATTEDAGRVDDTVAAASATASIRRSRRDSNSDIKHRNGNSDDDSIGHDHRKKKRSKKDRKRREEKKERPPSRRERHHSPEPGNNDSDDDLYHNNKRCRLRSSRSRSRSRSNERDRKHNRSSRHRGSSYAGGSRSDSSSSENSRRHDRYCESGSRRFDKERSHGRHRRQHDDHDCRDRHRHRHTTGHDTKESSYERQKSGRGYMNDDSRVSRGISKPSREPRLQSTEQRDPKKLDGYGLKGVSAPVVHHRLDLGPDKELLRRKRDERNSERRRIRETASTRRRSTEEERNRALYEMKADARKREEKMMGQHALHHREIDATETGPTTSERNPSFLNDITRQTHGISGESSLSLSARVAQNRHTNQRLDDSFL